MKNTRSCEPFMTYHSIMDRQRCLRVTGQVAYSNEPEHRRHMLYCFVLPYTYRHSASVAQLRMLTRARKIQLPLVLTRTPARSSTPLLCTRRWGWLGHPRHGNHFHSRLCRWIFSQNLGTYLSRDPFTIIAITMATLLATRETRPLVHEQWSYRGCTCTSPSDMSPKCLTHAKYVTLGLVLPLRGYPHDDDMIAAMPCSTEEPTERERLIILRFCHVTRKCSPVVLLLPMVWLTDQSLDGSQWNFNHYTST